MYWIPPQTLRDRVTGHVSNNGPKTLLTKEEEEVVIEHILVMSQLSYGNTHVQLRHFAGELAQNLGRKASSKPLSNNWVYGFLEMWRDRLRSLQPSKLESNRARSSTPEAIANYYRKLGYVLEQNNLMNRPDLIYILDETGLQPDHRPPNIVAPLDTKK